MDTNRFIIDTFENLLEPEDRLRGTEILESGLQNTLWRGAISVWVTMVCGTALAITLAEKLL